MASSTIPWEFPAPLRERPQWLCWDERERRGKLTKVPIQPESGTFASATNPETWSDYETAVDAASSFSGLGFVFTDDDPFVGVDLDKCRDPDTGSPEEWARDLVLDLDSYTEVSPSGTGFHIIIEGRLPEGGSRSGVEMYETARFFTMTGDHVPGTPKTVEARQTELTEGHAEHVKDDFTKRWEKSTSDPSHSSRSDLEDDELLEKARAAKNGAKFDRLYSGSTRGYDSHSEADMALCSLLAFWTGGDSGQMDRLFRDSGLVRPKWDEVHFADGSTYGEKTIERAIAGTSETYTPRNAAGDSRNAVGRTTTAGSGGRCDSSDSTEECADSSRVAALETTVEHLENELQTLQSETEDLRESVRRERRRRRNLERTIRARRRASENDSTPTPGTEPGESSVLSRLSTRFF
jgi:putative DNA primase/helicase